MKNRFAALAMAAVMGTVPFMQTAASADGINGGDDFVNRCCSREFYDYLINLNDGEKLQEIYRQLQSAAEELWNDDETDFVTDDIGECIYKSFDVTGIDTGDLGMLAQAFERDNCIFCFADTIVSSRDGGQSWNMTYTIRDQFLDHEERVKVKKEIEKFVTETAEGAESEKTLYDKTRRLHDDLIKAVDYAFDENGEPDMENNTGSIIGAAMNRRVVCEGYADAYKVLLAYSGLHGYKYDSMSFSEGSGHAWNLVELDDGNYYYVDCTWDDQGDEAGYDYFAVGQQTMDLDHPRDDMDLAEWLKMLPTAASFDYDPLNPAEREIAVGDVNCDGFVNVTDIMITAAHVKSIRAIPDDKLRYADMNGDDDINVTDLTLICARVKGLHREIVAVG